MRTRRVVANDDTGYWDVWDANAVVISGIESESEAFLIAAAPDLLEAARYARDILVSHLRAEAVAVEMLENAIARTDTEGD